VPERESFEEWKAKQPHLKEFFPYLEILHSESARGQVLVSTGFLEEQLREVLLAFMLENQNGRELLDGANAPLGTLSARIHACSALGLISGVEAHDLTIIRRIRNDFAHDIHTTFETPSVVDRCKLLRIKAHDYTSDKMGEVKVNAAGQFQTAAVALIMNLTNRPHYVSKKRCLEAKWPY
jgi:DNA-binding MltR family transcriptional regulator